MGAEWGGCYVAILISREPNEGTVEEKKKSKDVLWE